MSGSSLSTSSGSYYGNVPRTINRPDLPYSHDVMNSVTNEEDEAQDDDVEPGSPFDVNFSNFDDDYTKRAQTNEEEDYNEGDDGVDEEDLPFLDRIDSVKPVVDHQDRLWKQIDILDDVKKMSREIVNNGTFFNLKHSELLQGLKESQLKLMVNMKKLEKLIDESIYHEIWDLNDDDTFEHDIDVMKARLFDNEQFKKIDSTIDEIKSGLDELKQNIKIVDESSKDMWDNNDFSLVE